MVDVKVDVKERLKKIPGYQEGMPAHRMDGVSTFDELELTWDRNWGAQSGIGKMALAWIGHYSETPPEAVVADPIFFSTISRGPEDPPSNWDKKIEQLEDLVAAVESEGVEVIRSDPPEAGHHTTYFPQAGNLNLEAYIIKGGALLPRFSMPRKRGEERWEQEFLSSIGCPILWQPIGNAIHETRGNMIFLDPKHCVQGVGGRTNMEGVRQVDPILRAAGVEEIHVAQTPSHLYSNRRTVAIMGSHLCNVLNMVDEKLAVCVPGALPYDTLRYLQSKGVRLIETPEEEAMNQAANTLTISPGVVIQCTGNPVTNAALRKEGVRVIEVDMSETSSFFAGPLCLVGPMIREDGPFLDD